MKKYIILGLILAMFLVTPALAQTDNSALIAQLRAQIAELTAQLNRLLAEQNQGGFCWSFNQDLKLGDGGMGGGSRARNQVDDDVHSLRQFLTREGIAVLISSDGYPGISMIESWFESETQAAVKKFQAKYGIPNTGYVGPLTRAKLNALYGCNKKVFITPNALANAKVGESYGHQLRVQGMYGPEVDREIRWSVSAGSLPPGLELRQHFENGNIWLIYGIPTTAGTHTFTVQATDGIRTAMQNYTLRVLPKDGNNQAPVISGISGPTTLKVGETGTWTVRASDPENGSLTYSVVWGDEVKLPIGSSLMPTADYGVPNQTATFSHSYASAGSYKIIFNVFDSYGHLTSSSITAAVVNKTQSLITVTSPNGGEVWQVGSNQTVRWINSSFPSNSVLILTLTDGSTPIVLKSYTGLPSTGEYNFSVPDNGCWSDYCYELKPGQYKITASVYDRMPCEGLCPADSPAYQAKLLATDKSDGFITIIQPSQITVTSPNGGEVWTTYDTQNISWNWPNAKRTDKVDLWLDREFNCPTGSECPLLYPVSYPAPIVLDKNIAARASYNWIVATDIINNLIPAGQYRVRVCQAGAETNCDASDQSFTITVPRF